MNGKKPTRDQRKLIQSNGLDTWSWLVQKDTPELMQVVNKNTNEEKVLYKE